MSHRHNPQKAIGSASSQATSTQGSARQTVESKPSPTARDVGVWHSALNTVGYKTMKTKDWEEKERIKEKRRKNEDVHRVLEGLQNLLKQFNGLRPKSCRRQLELLEVAIASERKAGHDMKLLHEAHSERYLVLRRENHRFLALLQDAIQIKERAHAERMGQVPEDAQGDPKRTGPNKDYYRRTDRASNENHTAAQRSAARPRPDIDAISHEIHALYECEVLYDRSRNIYAPSEQFKEASARLNQVREDSRRILKEVLDQEHSIRQEYEHVFPHAPQSRPDIKGIAGVPIAKESVKMFDVVDKQGPRLDHGPHESPDMSRDPVSQIGAGGEDALEDFNVTRYHNTNLHMRRVLRHRPLHTARFEVGKEVATYHELSREAEVPPTYRM